MKKLILSIAVVLSLLTLPSLAQDNSSSDPTTLKVDVTQLSPEQLRVYQQLVQMQNKQPSVVANLSPDNLNKYAQVGKAFGEAFKECWGTVSTDAAKFAQSSTGKWAMVLVAWKLMGNDAVNLTRTLVQWLVAGTLFLIGIPTWILDYSSQLYLASRAVY